MRFKGGKSASFLLLFLYFYWVCFYVTSHIFLYDQMGTTDYRSLCSQQYERKLQYFIFIVFLKFSY